MRYIGSFDATLGETRLEIVSNCYTDALPLLRRLQFRGPGVDLRAQTLPLVCAILTRRYCGDQFELQGQRIGSDYAEAISAVLARPVAIANVDGTNRTIATGDLDIHSRRASDSPPEPAVRRDAIPFEAIDWAGDFVDRRTRRSTGFAFARYHTNASFFAEDTLVSIAIGLIHGRDRIRRLTVPMALASNAVDYEPVVAGLRIAGITLELVAPAEDQSRESRPTRRLKKAS